MSSVESEFKVKIKECRKELVGLMELLFEEKKVREAIVKECICNCQHFVGGIMNKRIKRVSNIYKMS